MSDPTDELSVAELAASGAKGLTQLTRAQAEEDVRYLFLLLKHGYAGYGSFQGDGNFDKAQAAILKELSQQETVTSGDLAALIHAHLDFIRDGHMRIGNFGFLEHMDYWYWDEMDFFLEGDRYWYWGDGGKCWLESFDGTAPSEYMKLALNSQGDPVYQLGILSEKQPGDFTVRILMADGTYQERSGTWKQSPFTTDDFITFSRSTESGIPVVVNRQCGGTDSDVQQFQEDANSLRNEPIFVLDIRGNHGGASRVPEGWMTNLTGIEPPWPFAYSQLNTRTALMGKANLCDDSQQSRSTCDWYDTALAELEAGARPRGWSEMRMPEISTIPNPGQLVVVLTDAGIMSSGEGFLGFLRQLENVVFVGENSGGATVYGDVTVYYLPNSGLRVQLDYKLFPPLDLSDIEGKGFMPDLWVPSSEALPYALAAIEKGWLQP